MKHMKIILALLLVVVLVPAMGAFAQEGSQITIGVGGITGRHYNPIWMTSGAQMASFPLILPGLTWFDGEVQPVLDLAESVDINDDATVYTFTLPAAATWSDGEPLTAEDVEFTVLLYLNPIIQATSPAFSKNLDGVVGATEFKAGETDTVPGVEVVDAQTIRFTLTGSDYLFLRKSFLGILPKHVLGDVPVEEIDTHEYLDAPTVTSGPYNFVEYEPDQYMRFERRADYWGEPAQIDTVIFRIFEESETLYAALEAGEVDIASIAAEEVERFEAMDGISTMSNPGVGYLVTHFNMGEALIGAGEEVDCAALKAEGKVAYEPHPPLDDMRVRQALAYTVDMPEVIDVIASGQGTPIYSSIFGPSWLDNSGLNDYAYNPDKAIELLGEAGWTLNDSGRMADAEGTPMRDLIYVAQPGQQSFDLGLLLQDYFGAVGVGLEIRLTTSSSFIPVVLAEEWDLARNAGGDFGSDPSVSVNYYTTCAGWAGALGFTSPDFDEAMTAGSATNDLAERAAIYNTASGILNTELPSLYFMTANVNYAYSDKVQGFVGANNANYMTWNFGEWTIAE
ncbi:MAG: peptide ABC transporter substrate-binding protein [Anaerolineae bacterium]|nr:peptide ABC transporter substrate-binding protein [Anaerolineae bacterium]